MNKFAIITLFFFGLMVACKDSGNVKDQALHTGPVSEALIPPSKPQAFQPSKDFKTYWYKGEAEISSYQLEQVRYGEMREGTAVLVFVTEDFLPEAQVKADNYHDSNIPILKLNTTKNFNTGVYPYSIMQSTFYPVANNQHAVKLSCSVQEWCGHVYSQLNNRDQFEITSHSYFENEADQDLKLDKVILENELWAQLRLDPSSLPVGDIQLIPSLEYIRLHHLEFIPYKANAKLENGTYSIHYQTGRTLSIRYNTDFPYDILGWEEYHSNPYGDNQTTLTAKATKLKTIKSPYWNKNSNADSSLRDTLQLK